MSTPSRGVAERSDAFLSSQSSSYHRCLRVDYPASDIAVGRTESSIIASIFAVLEAGFKRLEGLLEG